MASEFRLNGPGPQHLKLIEDMCKNKIDFDQYYKNYARNSDLSPELFQFILNEALAFPQLFPEPLSVPVPGQELILTQRQALCMLCHSFLNTLAPPPGFDGQTLSFSFWIESGEREKLTCLLHYFDTCRQRIQQERAWRGSLISYCVAGVGPQMSLATAWTASQAPLSEFTVCTDGGIEHAINQLQADFANAYIGGGVLERKSID